MLRRLSGYGVDRDQGVAVCYNTGMLNMLSMLVSLLDDLTDLVGSLIPLLPTSAPGTYEVLDHSATLDLQQGGKLAIYRKRQRVRFLRDNIIAYQDIAWGDGDIFAEYHCSPGVAVDRYKAGHRYQILISLRETKYRGESSDIVIDRTIRDGFTKSREDVQTEVNHRMHHLRLSVIFPLERPPHRVFIMMQKANRSLPIAEQMWTRTEDGRVQVSWETKKPRLFEAYLMGWDW